jgi:hypothetical protein
VIEVHVRVAEMVVGTAAETVVANAVIAPLLAAAIDLLLPVAETIPRLARMIDVTETEVIETAIVITRIVGAPAAPLTVIVTEKIVTAVTKSATLRPPTMTIEKVRPPTSRPTMSSWPSTKADTRISSRISSSCSR